MRIGYPGGPSGQTPTLILPQLKGIPLQPFEDFREMDRPMMFNSWSSWPYLKNVEVDQTPTRSYLPPIDITYTTE